MGFLSREAKSHGTRVPYRSLPCHLNGKKSSTSLSTYVQVWMPESDIDQTTCRTLVFKNLSCRTVLGTIMVPKSIITRPQKNLSHRGKKNLSLSAIGFPSLSGIHACRKFWATIFDFVFVTSYRFSGICFISENVARIFQKTKKESCHMQFC